MGAALTAFAEISPSRNPELAHTFVACFFKKGIQGVYLLDIFHYRHNINNRLGG